MTDWLESICMLRLGHQMPQGRFDRVISLLIHTEIYKGDKLWLSSLLMCLVTPPVTLEWRLVAKPETLKWMCQWRCNKMTCACNLIAHHPWNDSAVYHMPVYIETCLCSAARLWKSQESWSRFFFLPIKCEKHVVFLTISLTQNAILLAVEWVRKIRCENFVLVMVYLHCVLTGEKKTGSYLWISGYTWLI